MPASAVGDTAIRPFQVHVPEVALVDLRRRIAETRWPDREIVTDRSQDNQLGKLQEIARYWGTDYDWRKVAARLNALPMFMTETGVTSAVPGSARNLYLVVSDSEAAGAELVDRGVVVSEVFHRDGPGKAASQRPGSARRSYASYATFSDPDGNSWLLQEVTVRLPGRVDTDQRTFTSSTELASALSRAETAHGEHEKQTGQRDADWPNWYAEYIVREQAGKPPPS